MQCVIAASPFVWKKLEEIAKVKQELSETSVDRLAVSLLHKVETFGQ